MIIDIVYDNLIFYKKYLYLGIQNTHMPNISTGVPNNIVERTVGYQLLRAPRNTGTRFLPQKIAVFGQANTADQTGLPSEFEATTASEVGNIAGFGSHLYLMARILFPVVGTDGVQEVPVTFFPQVQPSGGAANTQTIVASGTPAVQETQFVQVNGRTQVDSDPALSFTLETTDTVEIIHNKIADAINASVSLPITAVATATEVTTTCKFQGAISNEIEIAFVTGDNNAGITYAVTNNGDGAGDSTPEVITSLDLLGSRWFTICVNGYGQSLNDTFENFNGVPGNLTTPATGRFIATQFTPFVALTGIKGIVNSGNEITNLSEHRNNDLSMSNSEQSKLYI